MNPLPELPLADSLLDRHGERRSDADWLARLWAEPTARVAVFVGDQVVLDPDTGSAAWLSPADFPAGRDGDWVFLGTDDQDRPFFAISLETSDGPLRGVREVGLTDPYAADLPALVTAHAVLTWHRRHPRCSICGERTQIVEAGWFRRCPEDDSQHFPRVDPAVIMLVRDPDDRALLGRQVRWPQGWFSTLAGFVEPGETLEQAVAREVEEEAGVITHTVTYRGSQPWPFPSSLMFGFHATTTDPALAPDGGEIAEAVWFTRPELAEACTAGRVRLPPRFSISRWLIEEWYGAELPGDWSRA